MKTNFNQPFKDFNGNAVKTAEGLDTIGRSLGFNLYNFPDKVTQLTPEQKYMAFTLSVKLANAEAEIEISKEEAALIDLVASRVYFPGYYGQIKELIKE